MMENAKIIIEEVTAPEQNLTETLRSLVSLLGQDNVPLSDADVLSMLESPNTKLLVARDGNVIVGMITLLVFRIPFLKKSIVEDLVVAANYQKHGIGKHLLEKAITVAKSEGASYLDLTSRPHRTAANIFYERFGFEKRNTNIYRLVL
jgi:ribosomal protein S18 acetylase RimI-like enzyme